VTGGAPTAAAAITAAAAPAAATAPTVDFERYLKEVMRAYLNLELSGCTLAQCKSLSAALRANTSVTAVNLSFCAEVTDESLDVLAEGLSANSHVSSLNLSACRAITDQGAAAFAHSLVSSHSLERIELASCHLVGDATLAAVAACLEGSPTYRLRHLNLNGCAAVTDQGLEVLAAALPRSKNFEALRLQGCPVTDVGVAHLAVSLEHRPPLKLLDLPHNLTCIPPLPMAGRRSSCSTSRGARS
jgi:hypothetical protein